MAPPAHFIRARRNQVRCSTTALCAAAGGGIVWRLVSRHVVRPLVLVLIAAVVPIGHEAPENVSRPAGTSDEAFSCTRREAEVCRHQMVSRPLGTRSPSVTVAVPKVLYVGRRPVESCVENW